MCFELYWFLLFYFFFYEIHHFQYKQTNLQRRKIVVFYRIPKIQHSIEVWDLKPLFCFCQRNTALGKKMASYLYEIPASSYLGWTGLALTLADST